MFITTANSSHNIPRPLLDRMEIINITDIRKKKKLKLQKISNSKTNKRTWA